MISSRYVHIVGFRKLRELLEPTHPYFDDARGTIETFQCYRDNDAILAYPRVRDPSHRNPYRKHRLRQKHAQRTVSKLMRIRESQGWTDLRFAVLVFTMPHKVSKWLSTRPRDAPTAWSLFERWWSKDYASIIPAGQGHSAYVNLHKWSTRQPNLPHYHFHILIPNKAFQEAPGYQDEEGNPAYQLAHVKYHAQRGGTEVPYSDLELATLKHAWTTRVAALARRHKVLTTAELDTLVCDVYVQFVDLRAPANYPRLVHKINYQSRHWIEDYAVYTNEHPHADNPPAWLEHYDNRSRTFGWMSSMAQFDTTAVLKREPKLSPLTGQPMQELSSISLIALREIASGPLTELNLTRDGPEYAVLSTAELAWLERVSLHPTYG